MRVPDWYIINSTRTRGYRPPHREVWKEPTPVQVTRTVPRGVGYFPQRMTQSESAGSQPGNLEAAEYQFFMGVTAVNGLKSVCRACGRNFWTTSDRKEHFTKSAEIDKNKISCSVKVIATMKMLQKDLKCVICDKDTAMTHWGMPLCSDSCVYTWKFNTVPSMGWQAAFALAERNGFIKEVAV